MTAAITQEPVLDDLLCFDLYSLSRTMTRLYRPVLEPHGLTYPQFLVLSVLTRRGPSTIGDIGRATRLDHGTLTPILRRMSERELVVLERAADDGRAVVVSLTDLGEALRPMLDQARCHIVDALGMSEAELARLQRGLHRVAERLEDRARLATRTRSL